MNDHSTILDSDEEDAIEEIAVIGMAGRFPGAKNIDEYWINLRNGVDSISRFSEQELEAMGVSSEVYGHPDFIKVGTIIDDVESFDAGFFGISPKEAEILDPQHRIFLETSWQAFENAGYVPETFHGSIGVFAGTNPNDYARMFPFREGSLQPNEEYQLLISSDKDFLSTRVSFKMDLRGPSITVQTACSTSLVAVHLACQSLLNYECDMTLAGAVSLNLRQGKGYFYQQGMILSPDGYCRAFDAEAQGTVVGQGVGVVVLKRLSDALADGDRIDAVIKGSAINNDGAKKIAFSAPSVVGQSEAIVRAQAVCGISPESIGYIEAHGTGTPLGDPIEIQALTEAFRAGTEKKGFCAIGSVKTNIGHLDTAAGMAGLIKTILMLKHQEIPPSLHFKTPNPNIDFENSPFYVNSKLKTWAGNGLPRRAGVSSFGIGGTNAHIVLEEGPSPESSEGSKPWKLVLLSARSSEALNSASRNLCSYLKDHRDINLAEVSYTLQTGRKLFNHRLMAVCIDTEDTISTLETMNPERVLVSHGEHAATEVAFMFPGQGSQYVNMGFELYQNEPVFRERVDQCAAILRRDLGLDIRNIIFADEGNLKKSRLKLNETCFCQPALFVLEYALAQLWMSWGIEPSKLVGHSIGEYVAACLAGIFSLEDGLSVVAKRGKLMQGLPPGSMLAVSLSEREVAEYAGEEVSIAGVNGPSMSVLAGENGTIDKLERHFTEKGIFHQRLKTSHAFHSAMMDPILDQFLDKVGQMDLKSPEIPVLSNLSGTWLKEEEATDPVYWTKHLRQAVRFADCVTELTNSGNGVLLEVGPGNVLSSLARRNLGNDHATVILSSLPKEKQGQSELAFIRKSLGRLWLAGIHPDWAAYHKGQKRARVALPTYPFERKRYWIAEASPPKDWKEKSEDHAEAVPPEKQVDRVPAATNNRPSLNRSSVGTVSRIEKILLDLWEENLGLNNIQTHDNYFEIGGDSLRALQLISKIREKLHVTVSMKTLYQFPTVTSLSENLEDQSLVNGLDSVVPLRENGNRLPLFLLPDHYGFGIFYRHLANFMSSDQPVYALQLPGLDGGEPPLYRIDEIASYFVDIIRKIQPEGPYHLGGYCFGRVVVYEIAQQLVSERGKVAFFGIFDHPAFGFAIKPPRFQRICMHLKKLWNLDRNGRMDHLRGITQLLSRKLSGMILELRLSSPQKKWIRAAKIASDNYHPKPYPGRIIFFRAKDKLDAIDFSSDDPCLGWDQFAEEGVEVHRIRGSLESWFEEPIVQEFAKELQTCLDNVHAAQVS